MDSLATIYEIQNIAVDVNGLSNRISRSGVAGLEAANTSLKDAYKIIMDKVREMEKTMRSPTDTRPKFCWNCGKLTSNMQPFVINQNGNKGLYPTCDDCFIALNPKTAPKKPEPTITTKCGQCHKPTTSRGREWNGTTATWESTDYYICEDCERKTVHAL